MLPKTMKERRDDLVEAETRIIQGRLLSQWWRAGKEVPKGFDGTLSEYAHSIARETVMDSYGFSQVIHSQDYSSE